MECEIWLSEWAIMEVKFYTLEIKTYTITFTGAKETFQNGQFGKIEKVWRCRKKLSYLNHT